MDAFYTFLADDGWAIASHIALSALMALFPFLIVLTSLAGFFGSKELADQAAGLSLPLPAPRLDPRIAAVEGDAPGFTAAGWYVQREHRDDGQHVIARRRQAVVALARAR